MARTKVSRQPNGSMPIDVYQAQKNFISAIVLDAILVCKGERSATKGEIVSCKQFLQSERCARWLDYLSIEPDCLKRII